MFLVRQTVRIHKVRIQSAKLRCSFVHHLSEHTPIGGVGNVLCDCIGDLIGRTDQDGVETLLHGQLLPHIHGNMVAVSGGIEDSVV